jgi:serine/threonine-protein kinase HipA
VSSSDIAEALDATTAPIAARAAFVRLLAFSYLIGNGDLHAKNVSVVDSGAGWVFSPAYDLLATLPYGDRTMALMFEGRLDTFRRKHFLAFDAPSTGHAFRYGSTSPIALTTLAGYFW